MRPDIRNGELYLGGCSAVQLAEEYGTPLYVYDQEEITARFASLRETFLQRWENTRVAYACKAFCTPAMLKLVQREGMCIDVVSGGELYTAMQAGFPAGRIEFNGNNKLPAEIELAVDCGVGRIIIDSPQELSLIEDACRRRGRRMQVLFRVTPGVRADTHDYIVTGKKDSKFGIPLDEEWIFPCIRAAVESQWVELLGLHCHIGSQLFSVQPYLEAVDVLLQLLWQVQDRFGYSMTELNIGGGFGISYTGEEEVRPYEYFLTPIMEKIQAFCAARGIPRPTVVTEPGRSVVGEAGTTLYTVGAIKDIPGVRRYLAVDGGMSDNIRPALYHAAYTALVANRADQPPVQRATVCGKCCESGDILLRDAELPPVEPGDILAVFSTGAYGYSMASNYNNNPIPAVVLVGGGNHRLIVKRQTYGQILENAVIPDDLREP